MIVRLVRQLLDDHKRVCGETRCWVFNRTQYACGLGREGPTCRFPQPEVSDVRFVFAEHEVVWFGRLPIIVNERASFVRPGKEQLPLISWQPVLKIAQQQAFPHTSVGHCSGAEQRTRKARLVRPSFEQRDQRAPARDPQPRRLRPTLAH